MTVPPLPDYQSKADLATLRRQIRAARDALAKVRCEIDAQIAGLEQTFAELEGPGAPPSSPFESAPTLVSATPAKPSLTIDYLDEKPGHIVLEATSPALIEQHLEQATLEELNQALSKAFSQVSGRSGW